jgi:hypothetical protein
MKHSKVIKLLPTLATGEKQENNLPKDSDQFNSYDAQIAINWKWFSNTLISTLSLNPFLLFPLDLTVEATTRPMNKRQTKTNIIIIMILTAKDGHLSHSKSLTRVYPGAHLAHIMPA